MDEAVTEQAIVEGYEERVAWRTNAPVLYDLFVDCELEWPALSVTFLHDDEARGCRLAIGSHANSSEASNLDLPDEVLIVELSADCKVDASISTADPWRAWAVDGLTSVMGFGCTSEDDKGLLRVVARFPHHTEVNRLVSCPHRDNLLATKAADGAVCLLDCAADPADQATPGKTLRASETVVDGFALDWNPMQRHVIASGGNDGNCTVWDVEAAFADGAKKAAPLQSFVAHQGALCDLAFSHHEPSTMATVGDDGDLKLWDFRVGLRPVMTQKVSQEDVLSVDFSMHRQGMLATAGKDRVVRVWDARTLHEPQRSLEGHQADAVRVKWAPFREDLLASASDDSRLMIWDLAAERDPEEAAPRPNAPVASSSSGAPLQAPEAGSLEDADDATDPQELLFTHAGHWKSVSDFAWNRSDEFLLCSVGQDNMLQIWQPSTVFYLGESDGEDDHGGLTSAVGAGGAWQEARESAGASAAGVATGAAESDALDASPKAKRQRCEDQ